MKSSIKKYNLIIASLLCSNIFLANDLHKELSSHLNHFDDYNTAPLLHLYRNNCRKHDISFNLSLLCYYAGQDGLDLADSASVNTTTGGISITNNGESLIQDFNYNLGFKAGAAICCSDWTLNAEYTRFNETTSTNQTTTITPNPIVSGSTGIWALNNWFLQQATNGSSISASTIASDWNLGLQFADLTMGHCYYENKNVSLTPFFGIRGAWINQNLDIAIKIPSYVVTNVVQSPTSSYNNSKSWAIGPRTGFDAAYLLRHGFKLEGSAGTSLLFTRYTNVNHSEQLATSTTAEYSIQLNSINCVRPELDLSIGLGWGTYADDKKYFVDISVKYDFLVLWQQNMMRKLVDQANIGSGANAGDLYLQGLNVSACIYF